LDTGTHTLRQIAGALNNLDPYLAFLMTAPNAVVEAAIGAIQGAYQSRGRAPEA
jgi:hypothetical protein